jgi:NarL family two-component system response regulator LiaR
MSEPDRIRVMIVDDHDIVRGGIRFLLLAFEDIELVGEARGGEEALGACERVQPDVVLMDMVMPDMDGVKVTQALLKRHPQVQVLVLTTFYEDDLVQRAMQAGAIGYLLKDISPQELADAIRAASDGRPTLAAEAVQALVHAADPSPKLGDDLSVREREVLALMVEGLSNAQIAERLVISTATAKYHVRGILAKLGASTRSEAMALAWQHNLVPR